MNEENINTQEFDIAKAISEIDKNFRRVSKKWPVEERKALLHFWKQAAEEHDHKPFLSGECDA